MCEKEGAVHDSRQGTTETHSEAGGHASLPCSRVQPVNWPQVHTEDAGHGLCSQVAAQLHRSCSCRCSALGRGTQNGDCLGL